MSFQTCPFCNSCSEIIGLEGLNDNEAFCPDCGVTQGQANATLFSLKLIDEGEEDGFICDDEELNWCDEHESRFTFARAVEVMFYVHEFVNATTTFKLNPIQK